MGRAPLRRLTIATASGLAAALLLGACAGGALSDDDGAASEPEALPNTAGDVFVPGPLDEFQARIFGYAFDEAGAADTHARYVEENNATELRVAECMAAQGFTYYPNLLSVDDGAGVRSLPVADDDGPMWGTLEFAQAFGYAISLDPWGDVVDHPLMPAVDDPNAEVIEGMSEAELEAWSTALWGEVQTGDYDPLLAGCWGQASADNWQVDYESFEQLSDEMNQLYSAIWADPRLSDLDAEWSACMAAAGLPGYYSADDARGEISDAWVALQPWSQPGWFDWDWEAYPDGPDYPPLDPVAVADLNAREIALAVADFNCQRSIDFEARRRAIEIDHQQQFVDRHYAELEAWAQLEESRRNATR